MIGLILAWVVRAEDQVFDLTPFKVNEPPPGFRSLVTGAGVPGEWKILLEEVPPAIKPFSPDAPIVTRRPVLAQLSTDPTDEHFPLFVYEGDTYGDFTLTTRFKTVAGKVEQMAGLAFRVQDEKNYYVVRASSLGSTFRFYKFVNGQRSEPIGAEIPIPSGIWHEMTVACQGNQIRCLLNGKEIVPRLTDYSFAAGKIGFWTKSDSVSYFANTRITYKPRVNLAQVLVKDTLVRYPRLLNLRIFGFNGGNTNPIVVLASKDSKEVGHAGDLVEKDVIRRGVIYTGKNRQSSTVTLPLHDRNGEIIAAVRVTLQSFAGQTEQNIIARAVPILKAMEERLKSANSLTE